MKMFILIAGGIFTIVLGAELLVRYSTRLSILLKISPLIIGLTIVAFGTSSPEMAVSVTAALEGQVDISLGNIIGSNIFNILFILGISAIITPLTVHRQLIRFDVPIMIAASALICVMSLDGNIDRIDGIILFLGIIAYVAFLIIKGKKEKEDDTILLNSQFRRRSPVIIALGILSGLILLVAGSRWLVDGSVLLAEALDINKMIVALTIVAIGTSLPEAATSIVASIHGQRDIAVGNIVGSNIFNILAILGLSAIVANKGIEVQLSSVHMDYIVMLFSAVVCLPIFFTQNEISRWEGVLFIFYYFVYFLITASKAAGFVLDPLYKSIFLYLVIPITGIMLMVSLAGEARRIESALSDISKGLYHTSIQSFYRIKRYLIIFIGCTVLLIGIIMIVLPGPAIIVIPAGLAILSTEFLWARKILKRFKLFGD